MSAAYQGEPVPSTMCPFRITTSKSSAVAIRATETTAKAGNKILVKRRVAAGGDLDTFSALPYRLLARGRLFGQTRYVVIIDNECARIDKHRKGRVDILSPVGGTLLGGMQVYVAKQFGPEIRHCVGLLGDRR